VGWSALDWIAEQRIERAIERGELSNLPGEGRPLPPDLDPLIPQELRNVVRLLRRSGGLPIALENLRERRAVEHRLAGAKGEERRMLMAKLAVLRARLERDGMRQHDETA
jgi:hypothetical protein